MWRHRPHVLHVYLPWWCCWLWLWLDIVFKVLFFWLDEVGGRGQGLAKFTSAADESPWGVSCDFLWNFRACCLALPQGTRCSSGQTVCRRYQIDVLKAHFSGDAQIDGGEQVDLVQPLVGHRVARAVQDGGQVAGVHVERQVELVATHQRHVWLVFLKEFPGPRHFLGDFGDRDDISAECLVSAENKQQKTVRNYESLSCKGSQIKHS